MLQGVSGGGDQGLCVKPQTRVCEVIRRRERTAHEWHLVKRASWLKGMLGGRCGAEGIEDARSSHFVLRRAGCRHLADTGEAMGLLSGLSAVTQGSTR